MEDGVLVFHEDGLVAVLACLDAAFYGSDRGRWYLEVGFGPCATRSATFETLDAALRWVADRLRLDASSALPDPAESAGRSRPA